MTSISPSPASLIFVATFYPHLHMVFKYLAADSIFKRLICIRSICNKRQATDKQVDCNLQALLKFYGPYNNLATAFHWIKCGQKSGVFHTYC
jgi:hypothetical protein